MIVRIMGLGQWTMEPEQLLELNEIDEAVERAVEAGDQQQLRVELQRLIDEVRRNGEEVPDDVIHLGDVHVAAFAREAAKIVRAVAQGVVGEVFAEGV